MTDSRNGHHLGNLAEILDDFGITSDTDWISIVLFVRNLIQNLSVFSDESKAEIQQAVFAELGTKDLSDERYIKVLDMLDIFILRNEATLEMEKRLAAEKRSAAALLSEMNVLIDTIRGTQHKQEQKLGDFEDRTVGVIEESEDHSVIVSKVREMFKELVMEFREEAQEWEALASELQRSANFDPLLTGIYNRRAFESHLLASIRRAERKDITLTLMMVDVDFFKAVNDTYGHQVGDDVLRALSRILVSQALQFEGYVARYGGEELVILAEDLDEETAMTRAESIRKDVEQYDFRVRSSDGASSEPRHFTVSVGVAQMRPEWHAGDLVRAADKAMYMAKKAGRNKVRLYKD